MSSEHILLDDQAAFHEAFDLAAMMLRIEDYEMYSFSQDLLEKLPPEANSYPRYLFIDWNLPGSDVVKGPLLIKLRQELEKIIPPPVPFPKIYVLSTSSNIEELKEAEEAGADGWIVKTDLEVVLEVWRDERNLTDEFKLWKV